MTARYLLLGLLGDHPEPVPDHAEHGSEVGQAHQDPEPDQRAVPLPVLYAPVAPWTHRAESEPIHYSPAAPPAPGLGTG